jgi:hypothetical protein
MVKRLLPYFLVLLLAIGGFLLYQEIRGQRADLQALKAADEKAQAAIAEKEAANQLLITSNVALREKDAASEVVKQRLQSDLAKARAEADKLREDLKTAPPEAILAKTQEWLGTEEISLKPNAAAEVEAVFSLAAFRLNADALADRHFMKFTLVPSLEAQIKESEGQNTTKVGIIGNLEVMLQNAMFIVDQKDDQINVRDEAIFSLKKRNLWRTVGFVAGSFAIGYIISR